MRATGSCCCSIRRQRLRVAACNPSTRSSCAACSCPRQPSLSQRWSATGAPPGAGSDADGGGLAAAGRAPGPTGRPGGAWSRTARCWAWSRSTTPSGRACSPRPRWSGRRPRQQIACAPLARLYEDLRELAESGRAQAELIRARAPGGAGGYGGLVAHEVRTRWADLQLAGQLEAAAAARGRRAAPLESSARRRTAEPDGGRPARLLAAAAATLQAAGAAARSRRRSRRHGRARRTRSMCDSRSSGLPGGAAIRAVAPGGGQFWGQLAAGEPHADPDGERRRVLSDASRRRASRNDTGSASHRSALEGFSRSSPKRTTGLRPAVSSASPRPRRGAASDCDAAPSSTASCRSPGSRRPPPPRGPVAPSRWSRTPCFHGATLVRFLPR